MPHRIPTKKKLRRPHVEFQIFGVLVGPGCGMLIGLSVELALGRANVFIMLAGTFAGCLVGVIIELLRFGWGAWCHRRTASDPSSRP